MKSLADFDHVNPDYLRFRASYHGAEREPVYFNPFLMYYLVRISPEKSIKFDIDGNRIKED